MLNCACKPKICIRDKESYFVGNEQGIMFVCNVYVHALWLIVYLSLGSMFASDDVTRSSSTSNLVHISRYPVLVWMVKHGHIFLLVACTLI